MERSLMRSFSSEVHNDGRTLLDNPGGNQLEVGESLPKIREKPNRLITASKQGAWNRPLNVRMQQFRSLLRVLSVERYHLLVDQVRGLSHLWLLS
jgi:hypothetical protein